VLSRRSGQNAGTKVIQIGQAVGQVHAEPQTQELPHRQPARRSGFAFWQPQVHDEPGQFSQVQVFD
jgi:hypothetical protein